MLCPHKIKHLTSQAYNQLLDHIIRSMALLTGDLKILEKVLDQLNLFGWISLKQRPFKRSIQIDQVATLPKSRSLLDHCNHFLQPTLVYSQSLGRNR